MSLEIYSDSFDFLLFTILCSRALDRAINSFLIWELRPHKISGLKETPRPGAPKINSGNENYCDFSRAEKLDFTD